MPRESARQLIAEEELVASSALSRSTLRKSNVRSSEASAAQSARSRTGELVRPAGDRPQFLGAWTRERSSLVRIARRVACSAPDRRQGRDRAFVRREHARPIAETALKTFASSGGAR